MLHTFRTAFWAVTLSLLPAGSAGQSGPVRAGTDSVRPVEVAPLTVTGRADDLRGIALSASQGRVGWADLRLRPLLREGELLETVPGVIVTQHSGDGKANQYFVRGFNLDHGTDFQTRVEGMPINLPSHAHGQGYTDLNFLIPELVDHLDFRLGIYHAEFGDFGSAGGVDVHLRDRLERPFATVGLGEGGLRRSAAGGSTRLGAGEILVAGEVKDYDGPWRSPEQLRKRSGVVRYSSGGPARRFTLILLGYRNEWNATDQIPARAVAAGRLGRFGAIDGTDGGEAERYSIQAGWRSNQGGRVLEGRLFCVFSILDLFSNFAYRLADTTNGDQFNQHERRVTVGGDLTRTSVAIAHGRSHAIRVGLQTRLDRVGDLGLYHTRARQRLSTLREDDVLEWGNGVWGEVDSRWTERVRTVVGARGDLYLFDVDADRLVNGGHRSAVIASPKASLIVAAGKASELYASAGFGFHSNDARGTTITVDPVTGEAARPVDPLVRSRGAEVGVRTSPLPRWRSTLTLWTLALESELLFTGDGGTTEPSAASRRRGVTWTNYLRASRRIAIDLDVSLARARFVGVAEGEQRIPGAMERVVAAGITWDPRDHGPFAAVRLRHFGAYPLTEDDAVRAAPTTLVNLEAGMILGRIRLTGEVLNVLDRAAADIQYYYVSRLAGEPAQGVPDVHFHPVEPRQLRVAMTWGL